MEEEYRPIETQIGFIRGRDAIFLDAVHYDGRDLLLEGYFNGDLATQASDRWPRYVIVFNGVMAFRSVELDSWYHLYSPTTGSRSSFAQIINSRWVADLGGKVTQANKHFYFSTYDVVFDIVCGDFQMKVFPKG